MMHDHYYTTPRPDNNNNMSRCRSRFFRHGPRENWPYRRVLRRRLSDSFSSNDFRPKCHECECCTRWNYGSDYYSRHLEPYYPDDDYNNYHRTGLTPAYQMMQIDSDHVAFFVEKSKLEAVLSSASGFIDKSKIPMRIELKDPDSGSYYNNKSKKQYTTVDHEGYDGQQRNPYTTPEKKSEMNDGAESDDSDSTVYFHELYPKGKVKVPEHGSSRNGSNEENSRRWDYDERDFSIPLKEVSSDGKYSAKINNRQRQTLENNNSSGYFTKDYKEYLQRNVLKNSPESAPVDTASTNGYSEACELPNNDLLQIRNSSQYKNSKKRWFNKAHDQPASLDSKLQNA